MATPTVARFLPRLLGVGRSIGDEPFLISQFVRAAIGREAMRSARRVLGQGAPSDAALARIQAAVLEELAQPLILVGMKGERAMLDELIRRLSAGELDPSRLSGGGFVIVFKPRGVAPRSCERLVFDHQRAIAIEWMNQAVDIARQPLGQHPLLWRAWESGLDRAVRTELTYLPASLRLSIYTINADPALLFGATRPIWCDGPPPGCRPASPEDGRLACVDRRDRPAHPRECPYRSLLGRGLSDALARRPASCLLARPRPRGPRGAFDTPPRMPFDGPGPDDIGVRAWDVPLRRKEPES